MLRNDTPAPLMTVGELSRRTGVSIKALRHYTDCGLIYTVGRSEANYRLFDSDALWCVQWIGELRGLGLTVAEIRELTGSYLDSTERPIGPRLAERLRRSRQRLEQRIAEQQQTLHRIAQFEADHSTDLTPDGDLCWAGDPRCGTGA